MKRFQLILIAPFVFRTLALSFDELGDAMEKSQSQTGMNNSSKDLDEDQIMHQSGTNSQASQVGFENNPINQSQPGWQDSNESLDTNPNNQSNTHLQTTSQSLGMNQDNQSNITSQAPNESLDNQSHTGLNNSHHGFKQGPDSQVQTSSHGFDFMYYFNKKTPYEILYLCTLSAFLIIIAVSGIFGINKLKNQRFNNYTIAKSRLYFQHRFLKKNQFIYESV